MAPYPLVAEGEKVILVIATHAPPALFGDPLNDALAAGTAADEVASHQHFVWLLGGDILEHGLESREIAMDVGKNSDADHFARGLPSSAFRS
jgi:hypothetical protein